MLRFGLPVLLLLTLAPAARADDLVADLVAITDDVVLIDVHAQTPKGMQRGWLVLSRNEPMVRRIWRELPKAVAPSDCTEATNQFSKVLEEQNIVGVTLDARQCKNDKPAAAGGRRVTMPGDARMAATRAQMAFPAYAGMKWVGRFTGKSLAMTRDGMSFTNLPTGLQPTNTTGWVAVSPNGTMIVAFDAGYGGFQLWVHSNNRWKSVALVDPLESN